MKVVIRRAVQILLSAAMLGGLLFFMEKHHLRETFAKAPLDVIPLVALGYLLSQCISAIRWAFILQSAHIATPLTRVLRAHLTGVYMNVFGFGTLGGDLTKAVLVAGREGDHPLTVATVAADRFLGLAVLAGIGCVSAMLFGLQHTSTSQFVVSVVLVAAAFMVLLVVPLIRRRITSSPNARLQQLAKLLKAMPSTRAGIVKVILTAVIFHLTQIALFAYMASRLGVPIPFTTLLVTLPVVNIASTLPLSWMGLGVREVLYVLFFVPDFMNQAHAILLGAVWFAGMAISAGVGGIVSAWFTLRPRKEAASPVGG